MLVGVYMIHQPMPGFAGARSVKPFIRGTTCLANQLVTACNSSVAFCLRRAHSLSIQG